MSVKQENKYEVILLYCMKSVTHQNIRFLFTVMTLFTDSIFLKHFECVYLSSYFHQRRFCNDNLKTRLGDCSFDLGS